MPQVPAYDRSGAEADPVALPDAWFAEQVSEGALFQAARAYQANQRQGTASTRTRSEVSGSGAKPWRQKGTGRARAGTRTSPIWTGGGTIFGPKPREYRQKVPKRVRRLALRSALRQKLDDKALFALEVESFERPQTSRLARLLAGIADGGSVLLLTAGYDENLFLSGRNIPRLTMKQFKDVTAYEILLHRLVLIDSRAAAEALQDEGLEDEGTGDPGGEAVSEVEPEDRATEPAPAKRSGRAQAKRSGGAPAKRRQSRRKKED